MPVLLLLRLKLLVLGLLLSQPDACHASVKTQVWSSASMLGMPDMVVYIYNLNNGEVETDMSLRFSGSHLVYSGKLWATTRGCLSNKVHSNSQLKWNLKIQGLYMNVHPSVYVPVITCAPIQTCTHTYTPKCKLANWSLSPLLLHISQYLGFGCLFRFVFVVKLILMVEHRGLWSSSSHISSPDTSGFFFFFFLVFGIGFCQPRRLCYLCQGREYQEVPSDWRKGGTGEKVSLCLWKFLTLEPWSKSPTLLRTQRRKGESSYLLWSMAWSSANLCMVLYLLLSLILLEFSMDLVGAGISAPFWDTLK